MVLVHRLRVDTGRFRFAAPLCSSADRRESAPRPRCRGAHPWSIIEHMSERRTHRGVQRTDHQILSHTGDMQLIEAAARNELRTAPELRADLARLAREDVLLAGFGAGVAVGLLPRGARLLAAARGELTLPPD